MMGLGVYELLIILAIFILMFGGKKIGELLTGIGKGIKEFKGASREAAEAEREIKR